MINLYFGGKKKESGHRNKILRFSGNDGSPGHKRPQPTRDPVLQRSQTVPKGGHDPHSQGRDPHEKPETSMETQPQLLGWLFQIYLNITVIKTYLQKIIKFTVNVVNTHFHPPLILKCMFS